MPTLPLPVKLTDPDRLVIQKDLSEVITALEADTEAKKEANKEANATLKRHRRKIHEINVALVTGVIEREVSVEDRPDYLRGVVETFRLDTKPPEVVKTRPIDPDERQLKINGAVKEAIAADGKPTDITEEQVLATSPEEAEELRAHRLAAEKRDRDRQEAAEAWLNGLQAKIVVFPADEDIDGFTAKIGGIEGYPWTLLSADGPDETAARKNLGDQLISQFTLAAEKRDRDRQERILAKLGELIPKITVEALAAGGAVAKLTAETWITEAEGDDEETAKKALRVKIIAILESHEAEIEKLTAEQGADAARTKTRVGLKAPPGHKAKKTKSAKADPPIPPADDIPKGDDGDGLAF